MSCKTFAYYSYSLVNLFIELSIIQLCPSSEPDLHQLAVPSQVTDRAAAALGLKADGGEVSELRLYVKGQFADVRAAAKEGIGRGRLTHTTAAGQTLCLSCDQPLSPLRAHAHEPLAQQGQAHQTQPLLGVSSMSRTHTRLHHLQLKSLVGCHSQLSKPCVLHVLCAPFQDPVNELIVQQGRWAWPNDWLFLKTAAHCMHALHENKC